MKTLEFEICADNLDGSDIKADQKEFILDALINFFEEMKMRVVVYHEESTDEDAD